MIYPHLEELESLVNDKLVIKRPHPKLPLFIYLPVQEGIRTMGDETKASESSIRVAGWQAHRGYDVEISGAEMGYAIQEGC